MPNTFLCSTVPVPNTDVQSWVFICSIISVSIISGIIGYWIGKGKALKNVPEVLSKAFLNMDNYVIIGSLILLVFSIGLSIANANNTLAIIILNVFSSIIFSWLLTKKTSIKDFKEKEEELALRSYRHINYIESAANTASCAIDKHISDNDEINTETKLILSNTKEQIKYIQGGINTCKMDWFDLLSVDEQNKKSRLESPGEDFGTVDTVISDEDINQEDA
jgi:uncharacterized membrane protein